MPSRKTSDEKLRKKDKRDDKRDDKRSRRSREVSTRTSREVSTRTSREVSAREVRDAEDKMDMTEQQLKDFRKNSIPYVRCPTCNRVIGNSFYILEQGFKEGKTFREIMAEGEYRYCCRMRIANPGKLPLGDPDQSIRGVPEEEGIDHLIDDFEDMKVQKGAVPRKMKSHQPSQSIQPPSRVSAATYFAR